MLVLDADEATRDALVILLEADGFEAEQAESAEAALRRLHEVKHDALVTELRLPDMDGFELLAKAREARRDLIVVVTSEVTDVSSIVRAMREGSEDYLAKPIHHAEVARAIERALERRTQGASEAPPPRLEDVIGTSPAMRRVLDVVDQIAPSRASVLITGESGTGKGLIAQAIHDRSGRRDAPFVKLHCSALAETLLELGSRGSVERIDGGTILLDEVGELSLPMQVKLLRFLQERTFEPVGAGEPLTVDVRVLAATHRNLASEVIAGRFREDLFYRLNVVNVDLPPLRARPSDVVPLAMHFLARFAAEDGKTITGFEDAAIEKLTAYRWPGNVRELENTIEHAAVLCDGPIVRAKHLPAGLGGAAHREARAPGATLAEIERDAITTTLEAVGGNTLKAAKMLDVSVRKIQYRLREYGIEPARRRRKGSAS